MESRAKALGHPIHPMLIPFPLGLLATSVIFDIIHLIWGNTNLALAAFYMILAGLVGGVAAAVFGLWDWTNIPNDTRAKVVGMWHGLGNLVVLGLFAMSALLRWGQPGYVPGGVALGLSVLAFLVAGVTGWLGGELVDRLGVGVDRGANLNAPNSLSGRPAAETAGSEAPSSAK